MASSRPEDPVAAAAKVIRIIHDDHTAANKYLHKLNVTSGSTRDETKAILQCMDRDEYTDVLQDLDLSQKAIFFDKVAGMNEFPSLNSSTLDKETAEIYFDALGLKTKGLSFKNVHKAVKRLPPLPATIPAAPSTPIVVKPQLVDEKKPKTEGQKTKNESIQKPVKDAPLVAPKTTIVPGSKARKEKKDKKDKKRKRDDDTPKEKSARPDLEYKSSADRLSKKQKTEPKLAVGPSQKRQKRREKQKLLSKTAKETDPLAAGSALKKDESNVEKAVPVEPVAVLDNANKQPILAADEDVNMESPKPAPSAADETAPKEDIVQANPKPKKVRRSKHKSEKARSKPAEPELPVQPPDFKSTESSLPENIVHIDENKKARRKRKAKVPKASADEASGIEPPVVESTLIEDASLSDDSIDDNDADAEEDDMTTSKSTLSEFARRTALPLLGKPIISATTDPSSDEEEDERDAIPPVGEIAGPVGNDASVDMSKENLAADVISQEPVLEATLRESSSEAVQEHSHSPDTRETSISVVEEVFSPPSQQQAKLEQIKSPVINQPGLRKPASASFTSAPAQAPLPKPRISTSFSQLKSSFTSTRPSQSANIKKSAVDSFAEFAAFASGKKPGYDSSDDDDDDSSSSSSESEDEKPAPVQIPKPTIQAPASSSPQAESKVELGVESKAQPGEPETETQVVPEPTPEAYDMDIDIESGITHEQKDPDASTEPIDVVMTNGYQDASTPIEFNDSQASAAQNDQEFIPSAEEEAPSTFQSFHETSSSNDAPGRSPLPDIPNPEDLMEFGGYQPTNTQNEQAISAAEKEEETQNSEPANRENHEGPELTSSSNSVELEAQPGSVLQAVDGVSEADEQASPSSDDEHISVVSQELNHPESENIPDEVLSQPQTTNDEQEEQAEAFADSLEDFLAAWQEETDSFEKRIQDLRQLLTEDSDGSVDDRIDMIEKLLNEVEHEEKVYKTKTSAASKAVLALPQLAREKIQELIDRADADFDQRAEIIKSGLREEYDVESANRQLSVNTEQADIKMKDDSEAKSESDFSIHSIKSGSSLGWAPSEDEGVTESGKQEKKRKTRKTTGATSKHFDPSPKKKRIPAGTSAVPFPKLSAPRFGLIQERLADDPFRLLIAVTFLNKTAGRAAVPIFEEVMELYPTPQDLADANVSDLSEIIHSLGFQNQRARKIKKIAEIWVGQPPLRGKLFRTKDYPHHGNGRDLKPGDTKEVDVDDCVAAGALEIAHIFGLGPYAWDSWRIFCRDKFRGVARGYNGEGVRGYNPLKPDKHTSDFEPEWKRVVPLDKELRACLRWMWLREGWEWDPLTGDKKRAAPSLMREASDGEATWNEPVTTNPHGDNSEPVGLEIEGPYDPEDPIPKAEESTPPAKRTRRSRNSRAAKPAVAPQVVIETKREATPDTKRLGAEPEIMTSRLRPRAGRTDAVASAAVPATPSRRSARR